MITSEITGAAPPALAPATGRPSPGEKGGLSGHDRWSRFRYRWLPDHVIGEILAKKWMDNATPFLFMVLIGGAFAILLPGFFEPASMSENTRQLGEFGLVVLGMMLVIAGGGIDLSVGSIFALANFATLAMINLKQWPVGLVMLIVVAIGSAVGLINGGLIGFLRLRAFLTTLVTLIITRACVDLLLLKYSIEIAAGVNPSTVWEWLGAGSLSGVPISLCILTGIAAIAHVFLSRTRLGWRILAVGGSRRSAHNVGLSVPSMVCITYVMSGALAGLAGFLYAARLGTLNTDAGVGLEVVALTAAILGGNSLGGGRSSTAKALMGAITVMMVSNSVIRLGLNSGAGQAVMGFILAVAIAVDVRWAKNRDKVLSKVYISPTFISLPTAPSTDPSSSSPFALNAKLGSSDSIGLNQLEGPEDVILDEDDNLYCGTRFGDIERFMAPDYSRKEVFCHVGGVPLGMSFAKNGDLYVCSGGMGLYAVSPQGKLRKLTDETNRSWNSINDDSRLRLADDLDIAPDGKVYFSEATRRYEMHEWAIDALEGRGNGRLICYDPQTHRTRTVLSGLVFPNGVCLAHDGKSILFAESWLCRISRYWLEGPKAGTAEVLINDLPGYPDNINRASDGKYWLAIMGMRGPALELALKMPSFRKRMSRRLPQDEWLYPNLNAGCVVKFDEAGSISSALWDSHGESHPMITSMREHRGQLYIGGITNNRIGRVPIDGADANWTGYRSYWGAPR